MVYLIFHTLLCFQNVLSGRSVKHNSVGFRFICPAAVQLGILAILVITHSEFLHDTFALTVVYAELTLYDMNISDGADIVNDRSHCFRYIASAPHILPEIIADLLDTRFFLVIDAAHSDQLSCFLQHKAKVTFIRIIVIS